MIPSSGCPPWPPDHPRTRPRTGIPTPPPGARPLYLRLRAVGLTHGDACEMPLTQAELADATGLSAVHVNRTLQELRGEGLITLRNGSLTVLDWDRLREAGEFDPTYLHLRQEAA